MDYTKLAELDFFNEKNPKNSIMAFYCEDPEMFCRLQKFPWLSIGINLSR